MLISGKSLKLWTTKPTCSSLKRSLKVDLLLIYQRYLYLLFFFTHSCWATVGKSRNIAGRISWLQRNVRYGGGNGQPWKALPLESLIPLRSYVQREYEKAEEYFERALNLKGKTVGEDHPTYAVTLDHKASNSAHRRGFSFWYLPRNLRNHYLTWKMWSCRKNVPKGHRNLGNERSSGPGNHS